METHELLMESWTLNAWNKAKTYTCNITLRSRLPQH